MRVIRAIFHKGIGHSRHRQMGIGFAPAIACGRYPHQAGILPVLHIAFQDAILYQDIAGRRCAFIINGDGTAPVCHGAIIHNSYPFCGDLLANAAGKNRCTLAVKIPFQPMSDGFMQHHPRPARTQHDFHLACRGRDRIKVQQGNPQGFLHFCLPECIIQITGEHKSPACPAGAGFHTAILFNHNGHIQPHKRANIGIAGMIGADNLYRLPGAGNAGTHLAHARVCCAGIAVDFLQQRNLVAKRGLCQRV